MIVLDASVVIKWYQDEADAEKAKKLQQDHITGVNRIIIPRLMFYEISNTFATKSSLPTKNIQNNFQALFMMNLDIYKDQEIDIVEATLLAKKAETTFYDMLYAVIAKRKKCDLVTADERFQKKTKFPFVKLLSEC